jgi:hypothetical protein
MLLCYSHWTVKCWEAREENSKDFSDSFTFSPMSASAALSDLISVSLDSDQQEQFF